MLRAIKCVRLRCFLPAKLMKSYYCNESARPALSDLPKLLIASAETAGSSLPVAKSEPVSASAQIFESSRTATPCTLLDVHVEVDKSSSLPVILSDMEPPVVESFGSSPSVVSLEFKEPVSTKIAGSSLSVAAVPTEVAESSSAVVLPELEVTSIESAESSLSVALPELEPAIAETPESSLSARSSEVESVPAKVAESSSAVVLPELEVALAEVAESSLSDLLSELEPTSAEAVEPSLSVDLPKLDPVSIEAAESFLSASSPDVKPTSPEVAESSPVVALPGLKHTPTVAAEPSPSVVPPTLLKMPAEAKKFYPYVAPPTSFAKPAGSSAPAHSAFRSGYVAKQPVGKSFVKCGRCGGNHDAKNCANKFVPPHWENIVSSPEFARKDSNFDMGHFKKHVGKPVSPPFSQSSPIFPPQGNHPNRQKGSENPVANSIVKCGYNNALREKKFELRFLLPSASIGRIIGKGGENINALRQQLGAQLVTNHMFLPDGILEVVCAQKSIDRCVQALLPYLDDSDILYDEMEVRLLVHHSLARRIGFNVKMLSEKMRSLVTVYEVRCPNSTDQVVLLKCARERMPDAVKELAFYLRGYLITSSVLLYDCHSYDSAQAGAYGSFSDQFMSGDCQDFESSTASFCFYCGESGHQLIFCDERAQDLDFACQ